GLSSSARHAGALRQQLGHDAARRPHAGVSQDHRVLLPRAFRHRAGYKLAAALGEIGVARAAFSVAILRNQGIGWSGAAMLPYSELEYGGFRDTVSGLLKRFRLREERKPEAAE